MRTRGQFSKPAPFNYQSHQSLQKFRKVPVEQRAQEVVQDIFKIKVKGEQNSKLIMAKNTAPSKQEEIKQLKKHIKLMENELKKKILENPILSRIFKTKQPTNGQMSHLDLYLQFIKLKQEQDEGERKIQQVAEEYKKKQMAYELQISQLKEQIEQRQQNFIAEIQKASDKFQKLQKEFQRKVSQKQKIFQQETIQRESKIQDNNLILEELRRKNHKISKQMKELQGKLNESKKTQQQRIKSLKAQFESYKQKSIEERTYQQDQIQKQKKSIKLTQENLSSKISTLENELAEKTLQIQQLDRFIELEKESYENQMYELQNSYEIKLNQLKEQSQHNLLSNKEQSQTQFQKVIQSEKQKFSQITYRYEDEIKRLKQSEKNDKSSINELQSSLQQQKLTLKKLQQQTKRYKIQTETQIDSLNSYKKSLVGEIESLNKKLTQSQAKVQKLSKEIQFLTHQKNEIHSKYEKGFMNTQNDIKNYQMVVDQLERKIYMLGNENIGLKKALEQKTDKDNKIKEFNRISQQTYQEKYKAIGRIEQIRHKLENYLITDFTRGFSNNFSMSSNNYRSNNSANQSSATLTESIEALTSSLDKLCDSYGTLNQSIETFRKLKQEDEREVESILNHFFDMQERQADLEEGFINYINVRKELNKQQSSSNMGIFSGDEYLIERKRQMCQFLIEKLIKLKVIKQYSSADQAVSSYRMTKQSFLYQNTKQSNEIDHYNSTGQSSDSHFRSSINKNSKNARKSMKKIIMEDQYRSNEEVNSNNYINDQYQETSRRQNQQALYSSTQNHTMTRKPSLIKSRQSSLSRTRPNLGTKFSQQQRMSTEPSKYEQDIEEKSTYEIMDENVDYGNFSKKRQSSKSKLPNYEKLNNYNSGNLAGNITADKQQQLYKKYKQQIKEKLMSGKGKRQSLMGLSKEDIEKKYFIR